MGMPAAMPPGLLQLEWCAMYSGPVREALHALKYRGERRLAQPLAEALAERWRRAGRGGDVLTWVPVHPSRRRERGFDQAELLAQHMGRVLELPAAALLQRRQRTSAQHALGRSERAANTASAFSATGEAAGRYRGAWVVVIDDILTTGATLAGCAAALAEGGSAAVSAATVARDR
jgi:ComF family protein